MTTAIHRRKRRQAREETRAQILAATERFLSERQFREMSVEELMAMTGHSRTVFYRHFADIADVLETLLEDRTRELLELIAGPTADLEDPEEAARRSLELSVSFFAEHGRVLKGIADAEGYDPEIELRYHELLQTFIDLTARVLAEQVAAGRVAALDPEETARALTYMDVRYLLHAFGEGERVSRSKAFETLFEIWRRVLAAPPVSAARRVSGDGTPR